MQFFAKALTFFVFYNSLIVFANCQITRDYCQKSHKCCQKLEKNLSQNQDSYQKTKELCQHELKQNWDKEKIISFSYLKNRLSIAILTFHKSYSSLVNTNFSHKKIPLHLTKNSLLI